MTPKELIKALQGITADLKSAKATLSKVAEQEYQDLFSLTSLQKKGRLGQQLEHYAETIENATDMLDESLKSLNKTSHNLKNIQRLENDLYGSQTTGR